VPEHISERNIEELDLDAEVQGTRKLEAVLFIAGKFLSLQELITLTDINPILIRKILSDLTDRYASTGLVIVQRNNSWKMDIADDFTQLINKLATGSQEFSKAEQETLAMIAYKQPMKQSVLIKIRGNKAYDHIKGFVENGFINKKKTGHTAELSLTDKFYEYFSMNKNTQITDLPDEAVP